MERKKICWISPDSFLDTDTPVVKELASTYNIYWTVILKKNNSSDDVNFVKSKLAGVPVNVEFYKLKTRIRSPFHIKEIAQIIKKARNINPDIFYLSESFMPYGSFLYKHFLPINKCVVACHNVTTPKGAKNEKLASWYTDKWLSTFTNIQTFSKNQQDELEKKYKGKNVLMTHLALKDYGEPTAKIDKTSLPYVRFLVFGNILHYKRIDLLLKAVNILYDKGIKNFKVRIAGNCKTWDEEYAPLITHPEMLELDIRRVPNNEVANLFADSHYFVMPYQDIAQSGAMVVAIRYNLPLVVSDIPQFQEFVKDGESGIVFKSQDEHSLAEKLEWIIEHHKDIYPNLCESQRRFAEENLTIESIALKYITYFDKL